MTRARVERDVLPPTELGDRRCFEVGYFGHGDIVVSTWSGSLDYKPRYDDGVSTRFGFAHGNDTAILASFAGYLARMGKSQHEIAEVMHDAGEQVLGEDLGDMRYRHALGEAALRNTAQGQPMSRYDENERGLRCLLPPTPAHPGTIDRTGGTAIYTRYAARVNATYLIFAQRRTVAAGDSNCQGDTELGDMAEFCEHDIPTMAQLVCNLALGEYRQSIHNFLVREYGELADRAESEVPS